MTDLMLLHAKARLLRVKQANALLPAEQSHYMTPSGFVVPKTQFSNVLPNQQTTSLDVADASVKDDGTIRNKIRSATARLAASGVGKALSNFHNTWWGGKQAEDKRAGLKNFVSDLLTSRYKIGERARQAFVRDAEKRFSGAVGDSSEVLFRGLGGHYRDDINQVTGMIRGGSGHYPAVPENLVPLSQHLVSTSQRADDYVRDLASQAATSASRLHGLKQLTAGGTLLGGVGGLSSLARVE